MSKIRSPKNTEIASQSVRAAYSCPVSPFLVSLSPVKCSLKQARKGAVVHGIARNVACVYMTERLTDRQTDRKTHRQSDYIPDIPAQVKPVQHPMCAPVFAHRSMTFLCFKLPKPYLLCAQTLLDCMFILKLLCFFFCCFFFQARSL